jgi:hypothetical protein
MATGKGVIQGYTGVATVDEQHQIIVDAQAHGTGSEDELWVPMVNVVKPRMKDGTVITADPGYHSEETLKHWEAARIDADIPDQYYRQRDERYADQAHHKAKPDPLHDKRPAPPAKPVRFKPADVRFDPETQTCHCPAGKKLYRNGGPRVLRGREGLPFRGAKQDCAPCDLRQQCLRQPDQTDTRQVIFFQGKVAGHETHTDRMKRKIDSPRSRELITRRFATVEPVFGNLRHNKRLHRFTLRGRNKVDRPWKLYCLVHTIEKLAPHGIGP